MGRYTRDSLEVLRSQVDLVELISSYVSLKPSGSSYKGLCPFHDEKSPSFTIQRGESHYHCFGCGAHGDAIGFLMDYEKMTFVQAVEMLADRFHVSLKEEEGSQKSEALSKTAAKKALQVAMDFYYFFLLHTDEGHAALEYLYQRGLDLSFIHLFKIGLAPAEGEIFSRLMRKKKIGKEALIAAGLIQESKKGYYRPFFSDRIIFPILDYAGHPIGFSARKFKEGTFGPKYINTPETILFKKSSTLYGLSFSRSRIAKEKRAIVVEGQIDALKLIQEGLGVTVAGQGTAFTEEHLQKLLQLGVEQVYLSFDGDNAGLEAIVKVGTLLQREGVEVKVVLLPNGRDPDTFLAENGIEAFCALLEEAKGYLPFLVDYWSQGIDLDSPTQKNALIQRIVATIRGWNHPLIVHESLRQLSRLVKVPEKLLKGEAPKGKPTPFISRSASVNDFQIDPDRTLETDLLRWLFLAGDFLPKVIEVIEKNLRPEHFYIPTCRRLFSLYLTLWEKEGEVNFLLLNRELEAPEERLVFSEIVKKKVDLEQIEEGIVETVAKILERHWMREREKIHLKIHSGHCSEAEVLELTKAFDAIKGNPPTVIQ